MGVMSEQQLDLKVRHVEEQYGSGTYTFSGTAAAATAAIRGLVFTPAANRIAPRTTQDDRFTIKASDGLTPVVTNSQTVVRVLSVNDAPVLPAASPRLTSVKRNTASPSGDLVSALLAGA